MKIRHIVIALAAAAALALAGCGSSQPSTTPSEPAAPAPAGNSCYAAYHQKYLEYEHLYGPMSITSRDSTVYPCGVCYVDLVDMDGDGTDEMIIAYNENPEYGCWPTIEIWSYRDNALCLDGTVEPSCAGTNGGFTYFELTPRVDGGGYVYELATCHGSAPEAWQYDLIGYNEQGQLGVLATRSTSFNGGLEPPYGDHYYSGELMGNAKVEVSESDYENLFSQWVTPNSEPFVHVHFFNVNASWEGEPACAMNVEQLYALTQQNVAFLAEHARS